MSKHKSEVLAVRIQLKVMFPQAPQAVITKDSSDKDSSTGVFKNVKNHWRDSPGKTVFHSIQYKNGWLAASDPFDKFTQTSKPYYTFYFLLL